jgi:hypothetical protein
VHILGTADRRGPHVGGEGITARWCGAASRGSGRVFCTAIGHATEAYEDPDFHARLRGGIGWAARPV